MKINYQIETETCTRVYPTRPRWMSHVTDTNESNHQSDQLFRRLVIVALHPWDSSPRRRDPNVWDVTHSYVWRDSCACVTRLMHMRDMTHSYVWHDSFICETWLSPMRDMTDPYASHDAFIYVTWLIYTRDVTRHPKKCVTWLILPALCPQMCVIRLIHMCDMTRSFVCHYLFVCETWLFWS